MTIDEIVSLMPDWERAALCSVRWGPREWLTEKVADALHARGLVDKIGVGAPAPGAHELASVRLTGLGYAVQQAVSEACGAELILSANEGGPHDDR